MSRRSPKWTPGDTHVLEMIRADLLAAADTQDLGLKVASLIQASERIVRLVGTLLMRYQ